LYSSGDIYRKKIEQMPSMKEKDLLSWIRRGGVLGVEAAKEVLNRCRQGRLESPEKALKFILTTLKTTGVTEKQVLELKNKTANLMIKRGFLDEDSFLTILHEIDSLEILEKATRKYRLKNKKIPNHVLRKIFRRIPALREEIGKILLVQAREADDLLIIEEEMKGSLQRKAWKKHWKKFGMSTEDAIWLMSSVDELAEATWKKLKKERRIKELSIEDLTEIADYTEIPNFKLRVARKGLKLVMKEIKRREKERKKYPALYGKSGDEMRELTNLYEQKEKLEDIIKEVQETARKSTIVNDEKMITITTS